MVITSAKHGLFGHKVLNVVMTEAIADGIKSSLFIYYGCYLVMAKNLKTSMVQPQKNMVVDYIINTNMVMKE